MREHLFKLLMERPISDASTTEDFFLVGPPGTRHAANGVRQDALLADIRRQQRHRQHALAA